MKLSKGFNKVLSLVLAGAMVLTGITVTDTKKADAADEANELIYTWTGTVDTSTGVAENDDSKSAFSPWAGEGNNVGAGNLQFGNLKYNPAYTEKNDTHDFTQMTVRVEGTVGTGATNANIQIGNDWGALGENIMVTGDFVKEKVIDFETTKNGIININSGAIVTKVELYVPKKATATATPTVEPTKAPASGGGSSAGGSSGSGSSTGSTSGAGTGEPTKLPEDQQFEAYIGLEPISYYPSANFGQSGGYEVHGFDQADEELPQTHAVEIDSTGVYSVALTGNMADEANGVRFFALYTEMTTAIQEKTGLIVKPVEVVYGSDTIKKFPSSAYIADGKKMRYSFVNLYAEDNAEANQFEPSDFNLLKDEGVYIKFVVAYSEEDAAKLVENYDDADTYEEIQDEVKEAKEELASKATPSPAPTPTAKPDVKPTPTAKPTVAPTLKVPGKITMGAKEKVTVKVTTNQASVKATSSKTSAVKVSASGKNIKLTAGKKAGSANITVAAGTKKATIKVTVKAAPKKIKAAKKTVNVGRGKKATTKVKFTPKKAAAYTIKVTNAKQLKKKKVTVTVANGKITVKADKKAKKGTLTVKLQTYNKKKTTFKVKVK